MYLCGKIHFKLVKLRNMRKGFLVILLLAMTLTTSAQKPFSPNVNLLMNSTKYASATRGADDAERAGFVITCDPAKSAAAIANSLKELGAEVNALFGNMVVVSLPLAQLEAASAIDGVLLIDMPSGGSDKTDVSRKATHAQEVIDGTGEKLPQAYTGKGVIVGIIDSGFDYTHPAFKDKDGHLRIKAVYQASKNQMDGGQKLKDIPFTDEKNVTTSVDLPGVLITDPTVILDTLKLKESGSHGTHCAAIAAGSTVEKLTGVSGGALGGMAPEADIVLANDALSADEAQKLNFLSLVERSGYYDATSLYALKNYADQQGKPLVISMSCNDHRGFHDGTSTNARIIGNYCKAGNLLALCASNEGDVNNYVERKIDAGRTLSVWINPQFSKAAMDAFFVTGKEVKADISIVDCTNGNQVVYTANLPLTSDPSKKDDDYKILGVSLEPDVSGVVNCIGRTAAQVEVAKKLANYFEVLAMDMQVAQGTVINEGGNPVSYSQITFNAIKISPKLDKNLKAAYLLAIDITPAEDVTMRAWSDYKTDLLANSMDDPTLYKIGTNDCSMGDWTTSGETVVVGAWIANNKSVNPETNQLDEEVVTVGDFCNFSSFGHDLSSKNRAYPDVSAPGYDVLSASNSFDYPDHYVEAAFSNQFEGQKAPRNYGYHFSSGTSMSTPVVAGIMALWVQAAKDKNKTLTNADIKDIIAHSCDTDQFTEKAPLRFGKGKINAYKGLLYVLGLDTGIKDLSLNQPEEVNFRLEGNRLYADGAADGTPVSVYDLQGVRVVQTTVQGGAITLDGLIRGVYAVQLGRLGSTLIRL